MLQQCAMQEMTFNTQSKSLLPIRLYISLPMHLGSGCPKYIILLQGNVAEMKLNLILRMRINGMKLKTKIQNQSGLTSPRPLLSLDQHTF